MIAVLERGCPLKVRAEIVRFVEAEGFRLLVTETGGESLVGVIGPGAEALAPRLAAMPGVAEVRPVAAPYPQVSREHHPEPTRVKVGPVTIGGDEVVVIGGPCAVESEAQLLTTARAVAAAVGRTLRVPGAADAAPR